MNIFKVLASGKKSFQEETASAILSWFMNPAMEHGLGYSFIAKFIADIGQVSNNKDLQNLSQELTPQLRSEYFSEEKFWLNLEHRVEHVFIDIIIGVADWVIAIENKIYSTSASDGQLKKEYDGLRKQLEDHHKIAFVYLVPCEKGADMPSNKIQKEFDSLQVENSDIKTMITWQENTFDNTPSIFKQIHTILNNEQNGETEPFPEYTRHTLKALMSFISNDFSGYEYERINKNSGRNLGTIKHLSYRAIKGKDCGYVGVKDAINGLIRIGKERIGSRSFQYTTENMENERNWIEVETFNKLIDWIMDNKVSDINWRGFYPPEILYKISQDFGAKVFIGIRGGEKALKAMSHEEIKRKKWEISLTKNTSRWISGEEFQKIMEGIMSRE